MRKKRMFSRECRWRKSRGGGRAALWVSVAVTTALALLKRLEKELEEKVREPAWITASLPAY